MTPLWPEYDLTISREALVENDEGDPISLFQHDAAAVRLSTIAYGKLAFSVKAGPRGSGQWTDEYLKEWAEEPLRLAMEHFLYKRREG